MVSANKISLTPLLFTEVPVPSKKRIMYLFVRGIDFAFVNNFSSGFWNCSYSVVFFVFHLIKSYQNREKISEVHAHTRFISICMVN